MSLWTPDGEHEVPRDQAQPAGQPAQEAAEPVAAQTDTHTDTQSAEDGIPGAPSLEDLSPEERAQAEAIAAEMAEARARIAETPAALVVANHAMGMYELAAIHLSQDPAVLPEAKVAIDAMAAVVEACEGRLGEAEATLAQALQQIQMVFVELSQSATKS